MWIKLTNNQEMDCFALRKDRSTNRYECVCLRSRNGITCGTKKCGFYKPKECRDWLRLEEGGEVYVIPPEEFFIK